MLLAMLKEVPPTCWCHNPAIRNEDHNTVAMFFAYNEIYPPDNWAHNCYLVNKKGHCVSDILKGFGHDVPDLWRITVDSTLKDP